MNPRAVANESLRRWFDDNPLPGTLTKREPVPKIPPIPQIRKWIVSLVGAVVSASALGVIPDPAGKWTAAVIVFLTSVGVYKIKNEPAPVKGDEGFIDFLAVTFLLAFVAFCLAGLCAIGYLPR